MNLNQLAKEICSREGLKKQVNIAQVKEIIGCLCEIFCVSDGAELYELVNLLDSTGKKRLAKKPKPSRKRMSKSEQRRLEIMGNGKKKAGKRG